jgi:hypothetical protein
MDGWMDGVSNGHGWLDGWMDGWGVKGAWMAEHDMAGLPWSVLSPFGLTGDGKGYTKYDDLQLLRLCCECECGCRCEYHRTLVYVNIISTSTLYV